MSQSICKCNNPYINTNPTNPQPCNKPGCIFVPHLLVPKEEAIYPCLNSIQLVDLASKIKLDTSQDSSLAKFRIRSHSDNIHDVQILSNGDNSSIELSFKYSLSYPAEGNYKFAEVEYEVSHGILKSRATVIVPFKNKCEEDGVILQKGETCNPCSGAVIVPDPEIIITSIYNKPEINL